MKLPVLVIPVGGAVLFATSLVAGVPFATPSIAATPPPTPPPLGTPATPQPNATLIPTSATPTPIPIPSGLAMPMGSPKPAASKATPTPPADLRKGLEGVWEVQIQHPNVTDYTHFKLVQTGNALTGTYLDSKGKRYPLAGSVDGKSIRLVVSMPNGTTMLLEGRLDGTTDMIGMFTTAQGETPFTASYRPKEKWIDNVNPSAGGLGSPTGGYTPP